MTPEDEIKTLRSLSQRAVAFLLGVTPRTLRDYVDLPRKDDGTYDCRAVVEWARSKARPPAAPFGDSELIAALVGGGSICDGLPTR